VLPHSNLLVVTNNRVVINNHNQVVTSNKVMGVTVLPHSEHTFRGEFGLGHNFGDA